MAAGSMFSVSSRQSANTGVMPRVANAFAVDTNVNDGRTTSSPGSGDSRWADISSASVQEPVRGDRQGPGAPPSLPDPPVPGGPPAGHRLGDVAGLGSDRAHTIERDAILGHGVSRTTGDTRARRRTSGTPGPGTAAASRRSRPVPGDTRARPSGRGASPGRRAR